MCLQGAACPAPAPGAAAAATVGTTSSSQLRSSTPGLRPDLQISDNADQQRTSKRQRKPQAWLQNNCAVLPNLLQSTVNPSPCREMPSSGSSRQHAEAAAGGSSTPRPLTLPSDPSMCRSARLKQRVLNSLGQSEPSKGEGLPAAGTAVAGGREGHRKHPRLREDNQQQQQRRQAGDNEDDDEYYVAERPAKVIRLTVCKGSHAASSVPSERAWLEEQQQRQLLLKQGARAGSGALHMKHSSHHHSHRHQQQQQGASRQQQQGAGRQQQLKPWQALHRHSSCPGNASSSCGGAAAADSDADCGYSSEDEEDVGFGAARLTRAGDGLKRRMLSLNVKCEQQCDKGGMSKRWSTPDEEEESGGSPTVGGSPWKGRNSFRGLSRGGADGGVAVLLTVGQLRAGGVIHARGLPMASGWKEGQQQGQRGVCGGQQSPSLVELKEPLEEHVVLLDHDPLGQVRRASRLLGRPNIGI